MVNFDQYHGNMYQYYPQQQVHQQPYQQQQRQNFDNFNSSYLQQNQAVSYDVTSPNDGYYQPQQQYPYSQQQPVTSYIQAIPRPPVVTNSTTNQNRLRLSRVRHNTANNPTETSCDLSSTSTLQNHTPEALVLYDDVILRVFNDVVLRRYLMVYYNKDLLIVSHSYNQKKMN